MNQENIEIIPAIDLIDGKCVRLQQGNFAEKTVYHDDPLCVAQQFEDSGMKRLHLVDLDGAKAGRIVNQSILEKIAKNTSLVIDFGGGLKSDNDLEIAFNSGASMVTVGSIAVKNRELFLKWLQRYGNEKIILGADSRNGMVAVGGWMESTSLKTVDFVESCFSAGIRKVISTEISRDGMLDGPAFELYQEILERIPGIMLIASGGVSSMSDIIKLDKMGIQGVIIGKAIYENRITLAEITGSGHFLQRFGK